MILDFSKILFVNKIIVVEVKMILSIGQENNILIFQGFDWEGLDTRSLTPPIAPKVESAADTSNFDKYPRDEAVPQDELSGWDKDF